MDTYLYLLDSSDTVIYYNDDGGIGLNSKLRVHLSSGIYTVVAATYRNEQSGTFELSTNEGMLLPADDQERYSAWAGTYETQATWWSHYFSPLVVYPDGTIDIAGITIHPQQDPAATTLSFDWVDIKGGLDHLVGHPENLVATSKSAEAHGITKPLRNQAFV